MNISDELERLQTLLRNGTLTQQEFEQAKQRVLNESPVNVPVQHLEAIKAQNEVAQLDRAWELERENYMITGRYGSRHIPTRTSSVFGGLFIVGFGIFWTIIALGMTLAARSPLLLIFPLFGVMFVLGGAFMSISAFFKAGKYQQAYESYQSRRQELVERQQHS